MGVCLTTCADPNRNDKRVSLSDLDRGRGHSYQKDIISTLPPTNPIQIEKRSETVSKVQKLWANGEKQNTPSLSPILPSHKQEIKEITLEKVGIVSQSGSNTKSKLKSRKHFENQREKSEKSKSKSTKYDITDRQFYSSPSGYDLSSPIDDDDTEFTLSFQDSLRKYRWGAQFYKEANHVSNISESLNRKLYDSPPSKTQSKLKSSLPNKELNLSNLSNLKKRRISAPHALNFHIFNNSIRPWRRQEEQPGLNVTQSLEKRLANVLDVLEESFDDDGHHVDDDHGSPISNPPKLFRRHSGTHIPETKIENERLRVIEDTPGFDRRLSTLRDDYEFRRAQSYHSDTEKKRVRFVSDEK